MRRAPLLPLLLATISAVLGARIARSAPADAGATPRTTDPIRDDTVLVDRDDVEVRASCTLAFPATPIADRAGDGVVRILGRDDGARIVIDLGGARLVGGAGAPESHAGVGILVRGRNVTIRNGAIAGFKVALHAEDCDGLVVEDLVTSDNYAQRLRSTPAAEDGTDWLFPHRNDGGEWIREHGAGVSVRRAKGAVVRRVTSHRTQNGIVLDRVEGSEIYDNDCSFLSGWGIAMWRSASNTVCRNSLDFCIRGYSHGVYNRGQDSAGLLMFEQCSGNVVALNSITHGGDGVFGFAGREALGEGADGAAPDASRGAGCNGNWFIGNDLSFAAAHGLEMTFSFGNRIVRNRFESNAICGIWGGYARDTLVAGNDFRRNGAMGYGGERGGVNMEHAQRTVVASNTFREDRVGVRLWTDADEGIRRLPWGVANGMGAESNRIVANAFSKVAVPVELIDARATTVEANDFDDCAAELVESGGEPATVRAQAGELPAWEAEAERIVAALPGERAAIGRREELRGRERIVMREHAPYAWDGPILVPGTASQSRATFRAIGFGEIAGTDVIGNGPLLVGVAADGVTVEVASKDTGFATPFTVQVRGKARGERATAKGVIAPGAWATRIFALDAVPEGAEPVALGAVPDPEAFRRRAALETREFVLKELDFDFANAGPSQAVPDPDVERLAFASDRFGLVSETTLAFRPGRWRAVVESDDGVRLFVDGKVAIERWDIHGPTTDRFEFTVAERREVPLRIEYFENDGFSRLRLRFEHLGKAE